MNRSPVVPRQDRAIRRCGRCGTSLTFQNSDGSIDVTLASLDDPEQVPPTQESWLAHRLSWAPVDERLVYNQYSAE